jgi:hypothetical protein
LLLPVDVNPAFCYITIMIYILMILVVIFVSYPLRLTISYKQGTVVRLGWLPSIGISYRPQEDWRRLTFDVATFSMPVFPLRWFRARKKDKASMKPAEKEKERGSDFFNYVAVHYPRMILHLAGNMKNTCSAMPGFMASYHLYIDFFPGDPETVTAVVLWREMFPSRNLTLNFHFIPGVNWCLDARLSPLAMVIMAAVSMMQLPVLRLAGLWRDYRKNLAAKMEIRVN